MKAIPIKYATSFLTDPKLLSSVENLSNLYNLNVDVGQANKNNSSELSDISNQIVEFDCPHFIDQILELNQKLRQMCGDDMSDQYDNIIYMIYGSVSKYIGDFELTRELAQVSGEKQDESDDQADNDIGILAKMSQLEEAVSNLEKTSSELNDIMVKYNSMIFNSQQLIDYETGSGPSTQIQSPPQNVVSGETQWPSYLQNVVFFLRSDNKVKQFSNYQLKAMIGTMKGGDTTNVIIGTATDGKSFRVDGKGKNSKILCSVATDSTNIPTSVNGHGLVYIYQGGTPLSIDSILSNITPLYLFLIVDIGQQVTLNTSKSIPILVWSANSTASTSISRSSGGWIASTLRKHLVGIKYNKNQMSYKAVFNYLKDKNQNMSCQSLNNFDENKLLFT